MKQKNKTRLARAAMTLLLALLTTFGAWAQVQIGDGTSINSYLPSYSLYNYSVSQQIYTAQEIAASGTITSIAFYNGGTEKSRKYNIYMAHTTKSAFDNNTDWIELTEANLVYEGTEAVAMTAGAWTTFTLNTPFAYNGTDNLVIGVLDLTGSWQSGMSCRVFSTATNQALYKYQDSGAFGIDGTYNESAVTGTLLTVKNQIILGGIQQAFPTPSGLTATPHTYSADLSWTENGSATSWEICINDDESDLILTTSNPYTLDNLDPETTYSVKVRSVSGSQTSTWSGSVSFTTAEVCPDGKVCIGSGTATNSYIPTYTYYNYSLTQQIYTAAELGEDGYILSVDFHSSAAQTRTLDIYMVSTDKNSFESANDWIPVTAADKVFSGSVTFAANGWTTIEFDAPFAYDGRSNVALIIDDNTGSYVSSPSFYAFSATSQAIRIYSDDTNYNPESPSSYNGTVLTQKNRVRFAIGEPPSCPKPKNLAASNVTNHTATLTWTAGEEETQWTVEYGKNSDFTSAQTKTVNTNPTVELAGLDAETVYYARVKANCSGGDASQWTDAISFETQIACPAPTNLAAGNITATSAEISWTGNADATSYNLRYREVDPSTMATVILTAGDVWGDGTGYQMLLDADATAYGTIIPESGGLTTSGDASAETYAEFEYKIPTNADGALSTSNIVLDNSISIQIPAGIYDWCITNPTPGDRMWIASANGIVPGRNDDYAFEAGKTYEFTVSLNDGTGNDQVDVTITDAAKAIALGESNQWTTVYDATSPYSITGLTPSTAYEVEVQAVYADGTSTWVGTNFTTLEEVPRPSDLAVSEITSRTAKLNWTENGDATAWELCLNNDESNLIAADSKPFTLPNLTPETQYSVKVRAIKGEKKSDWSSSITFTTDIACPAPTELTADNITSTTAEIIWNADPAATGFELQYAERPAVTGTSVLSYDNGTYATSIGLNSIGTWTWGVMYPGSMVTATALNKVSIFETDYNTGEITINVYQGGDDAPGTLLYTETVAPKAADGFHEVMFSSPVALTAGENLWITLTETGTYVMNVCTVNDDNNQWVYNNGAWANIATLSSSLQDYGWMIRAEIGTAASTELIWSNSEDATSPYEMSGLTPGSTYVVRVKAIYGEEGSDWASTIFTTDALAPTDLTVNNILSSSATISWTGYCDTYNVYLGTEGEPTVLLSADFEGQTIPNGFTNDATYPWEVVEGNNGYCIQSSNAGVASSTSAISVSKTFTKDGTIEFDAECKGEGTSTAWDKCIFSIDGTTKFSYGAHVTGWNHYSFPVPAGEHTFTWSYSKDGSVNPTGDYFAVDNIVINESNINWADTPIEVTETECALTGLTPNTTYYVQVVGVIGENNYESGIVSFTTLASIVLADADENADVISQYQNETVDVTLAGRTLYKNGDWNTICLPFNVTLAGSPLDGAIAKTLSDATVSGDHVSLTFGNPVETLTAGVPYIVKWANGSGTITNPVFKGVKITSTQGQTISKANEQVKFIGYYDAFEITPDDDDIFYMTAGNTLSYFDGPGDTRKLNACRAYFKLTGFSSAPSFSLDFGDETTYISKPEMRTEEDGEWYTLQGLKIGKKPTTTGVYIHNGRKVIIK